MYRAHLFCPSLDFPLLAPALVQIVLMDYFLVITPVVWAPFIGIRGEPLEEYEAVVALIEDLLSYFPRHRK